VEDERGRPAEVDAGRLDERVLSALQGLPGRLAFSGLRRMLGAHPESLSRSLRRLAREGLVEKVDGGYRSLARPPRVDARTDRQLRPIARIDLPPGAPPRALLGRLVGRWFGTLRWVGLLERPEGELLAWARRDGDGLVLLGVDRGVLSVYAPRATEHDDLPEAEEAAYELLFHAVEALRPTPVSPPPSLAGVRAFAAGGRAGTVAN
jgi:DNA-binding Lrp family transcriptional regulator